MSMIEYRREDGSTFVIAEGDEVPAGVEKVGELSLDTKSPLTYEQYERQRDGGAAKSTDSEPDAKAADAPQNKARRVTNK